MVMMYYDRARSMIIVVIQSKLNLLISKFTYKNIKY